jgi:hypothetical protein
MPIEGVLRSFRKSSGWQGQDAGMPARLLDGVLMLAIRKSSHEARAAFIPRRHNAVKPRIQHVLTQ